jgi:DNA-binding NarL/FixJ family response regulator
MFISAKTVERHKSNILKKLKAKNTAQMVKIGIENGLIM